MFTRHFFLFALAAMLTLGYGTTLQSNAQEVTVGQNFSDVGQRFDALKRYIEAKINHLENLVNTNIANILVNTNFRTNLATNGCPTGQYLAEVDADGNTTCRTDQTGGGGVSFANMTCDDGKFVFGFDAAGYPRCKEPEGGGGTTDPDPTDDFDDALNDYFNNMRTGVVASTGCNGHKGQGCVTVSAQIAEPGTHCFVHAERMDATYRYNSFFCQYNKTAGSLTAHGKPNAQHSAMATATCRYFCPRGSAPAGGVSTDGSGGGNSGNSSSGNDNDDYFGYYEDYEDLESFDHR